MYRVVVKSRGKYNNTQPGIRYCLTKKTVAELGAHFHLMECDYDIEKFVRLHGDVFAWSDADVSEKVWDKLWEIVDNYKEDEEE